MPRSVNIVEFPSNLGLIEPAPGKAPGVRHLPDSFRKHGLHGLIEPVQIVRLDAPDYSMQIDPQTGIRNADAIVRYARQQADLLKKFITTENFTLVLGGDCSILIGTALALKQRGRYALFYLDGHTDFIHPEQSGTRAAAGMDLAMVTGYAHDKFADIDKAKPYVREGDVFCVGNRAFETGYVQTILSSGLTYYDIDRLRKDGMEACVQAFFEMISKKNTQGFWIHLDADVLDSTVMPAVDSPDPGGISYTELNAILSKLISHPACCGMEITILDPDLDPEGMYVKEFIAEVGTTIKHSLG